MTIFMFFEPLAYLDTWNASRFVRFVGASQTAFDGPIWPGVDPVDGKGAESEDGALGLIISVTVTVSVTVVGVAGMVMVVGSSSVTVTSAMGAILGVGADVMYEKENGYWLSLGMMAVWMGGPVDSAGGARSKVSTSLMWASVPRRRLFLKRRCDPEVTGKGAGACKHGVLFVAGAATITCSPPRKRRQRTALEVIYKKSIQREGEARASENCAASYLSLSIMSLLQCIQAGLSYIIDSLVWRPLV